MVAHVGKCRSTMWVDTSTDCQVSSTPSANYASAWVDLFSFVFSLDHQARCSEHSFSSCESISGAQSLRPFHGETTLWTCCLILVRTCCLLLVCLGREPFMCGPVACNACVRVGAAIVSRARVPLLVTSHAASGVWSFICMYGGISCDQCCAFHVDGQDES